VCSSEFVFDYCLTDLIHLIGLRFPFLRLQIDDFIYASLREKPMASLISTILEPQMFKQRTEVVESDILIGFSPENLCSQFVVFSTHGSQGNLGAVLRY
jgi:hypothetical protein